MPFHTLASENLDAVKHLSTVMDPRSLQMLRCVSKVFRDAADKEQCIASAIAKYTRATLCNGAFRINSLYGYHTMDIFPLTNDSGIDGLERNEGNQGNFVFGEAFNVIVEYQGLRYKGMIHGDFTIPPNIDSSDVDLGSNFFRVGSEQSFDPDTQRSWIVVGNFNEDGFEGIVTRLHVDVGGDVGEAFTYFFMCDVRSRRADGPVDEDYDDDDED